MLISVSIQAKTDEKMLEINIRASENPNAPEIRELQAAISIAESLLAVGGIKYCIPTFTPCYAPAPAHMLGSPGAASHMSLAPPSRASPIVVFVLARPNQNSWENRSWT